MIILERLRTTVDDTLIDNQASFHRERSCTDQIATLYELPQSSLLNGILPCMPPLWMLKRLSTAWKLMRHYAIPEKFVILIHNTCEGMTCNIIHAGKIYMYAGFEFLTGVRQGCIL